jgi:hypothetical protein
MAQAFEGALAALHRVAEERADDCADEVERHRCAGARASAVRAVGPASRSRRRRRDAARPHAAAGGAAHRVPRAV